MKKALSLCVFLSWNAFAGCNFGNSESLTTNDFEYMEKDEVAAYFCGSMITVKSYDEMAASFKNSMPSMANDYKKGSGMCRTEIKRSSLVLAKKHGLSKEQLGKMQSIINGGSTGDNLQRCIAVSS